MLVLNTINDFRYVLDSVYLHGCHFPILAVEWNGRTNGNSCTLPNSGQPQGTA